MIKINIAKDFTTTPGHRYKKDHVSAGYSGEEFRQQFLEPHFKNESTEKIVVTLDGTYGLSPGFLEEAFGGLARIYDPQTCLNRISFISEGNPHLIDEILENMIRMRDWKKE